MSKTPGCTHRTLSTAIPAVLVLPGACLSVLAADPGGRRVENFTRDWISTA